MTFSKPLVRWTIGNVQPDGYQSLKLSIESFIRLYDIDPVICYNCPLNNFGDTFSRFPVIDQHEHLIRNRPAPKGVAWKLYPSRLDINRHEILIDNDLILEERIPEIDQFLSSDCTLMLEDRARTYGRFEKHIAPGYQINSGIFGMPPLFDLQKYIDFYCGDDWEENAVGVNKESVTFDEQGLVAIALLSYPRHVIIPSTCITNCENTLVVGKGYHFIGLNRREFHQPFRLFKWNRCKTYL